MKWSEAAAVFAAWGAWRATGSARAGRSLVRSLASSDETSRTAAGVLLVRSGARALPLLRENLGRAESRVMTLRLLGDIGGPEAAGLIRPYLGDADAAVARAAAESLQSIQGSRGPASTR